MKKFNCILTIGILLFAANVLTGCQSSDQKVKAANDKVQVAQQELAIAQNIANVETQKAVTAEELKTFKLETELTVKNNEVSIAELKLKMRKSGSAMDELYAQRIDTLEMRNKGLKDRFTSYEKSQSNWENFKFEVNHDLDEIGRVLKELSPKNTK